MIITPEIRRELGAKRAAVAHLLTHEVRRRKYNNSALARELGITNEAVRRVINGLGHSPRVLDKLREIGVPERYLFDPRRMRPEQEAV